MDIRIGTSSFKVIVTSPMTKCMGEYGPRFDTLGAVTSIKVDGSEFCSREGLSLTRQPGDHAGEVREAAISEYIKKSVKRQIGG